MATIQKITPCLWFDDRIEDAVNFYTSVFKNSEILRSTRYGKEGFEVHHMPEGAIMTIEFTLDGQKFLALNGGPIFQFNEAVSFIVNCDNQQQVDHYWNKLTEGGDEKAQQCGWLKDKFGLSWQIVPTMLPQLLTHSDPKKSQRAMKAMLQMKKIDINQLKQVVEEELV